MAESKSANIELKHVDPEGGLKENRNPVIFLHAMLCSSEIWGDVPQMVANATGRRVYTYDARNHGDSEVREDSNFKFNVDDLFAQMERIKAQMDSSPTGFVLVGHDMGGRTAMGAALADQEKFQIEKLFIVDMYAKPIESHIIERTEIFSTKWAQCVREIPENTPIEKVTQISVDKLYSGLDPSMKEDVEEKSYRNGKFSFKKTGGHYEVKYHTQYILKALGELKNEEHYTGKYSGPTYFLYGSASHFNVIGDEKTITEHFPEKQFVKFDNGSHFFINDVPTKLAEELSVRM